MPGLRFYACTGCGTVYAGPDEPLRCDGCGETHLEAIAGRDQAADYFAPRDAGD